MRGESEQARLRSEFDRLNVTADALARRLQRTLVALALTLDACALTQQRLHGHTDVPEGVDDYADLLTAATLYRHLAESLAVRAG